LEPSRDQIEHIIAPLAVPVANNPTLSDSAIASTDV
jgi:hypothetical protein